MNNSSRRYFFKQLAGAVCIAASAAEHGQKISRKDVVLHDAPSVSKGMRELVLEDARRFGEGPLLTFDQFNFYAARVLSGFVGPDALLFLKADCRSEAISVHHWAQCVEAPERPALR